jgi:hypothetical protein
MIDNSLIKKVNRGELFLESVESRFSILTVHAGTKAYERKNLEP